VWLTTISHLLFPPFLISGLGLALAFIPMSIGALTGVQPAEAGVASGLINTSQQVGGAIGVAIATTIATSVTSRYVDAHVGSNAFSGPALTHGFHIAFYVLAGLAAAGALLSVLMLEPRPAQPEPQLTSEAFGPEEAQPHPVEIQETSNERATESASRSDATPGAV
jgi:sugar phosphate permease